MGYKIPGLGVLYPIFTLQSKTSLRRNFTSAKLHLRSKLHQKPCKSKKRACLMKFSCGK